MDLLHRLYHLNHQLPDKIFLLAQFAGNVDFFPDLLVISHQHDGNCQIFAVNRITAARLICVNHFVRFDEIYRRTFAACFYKTYISQFLTQELGQF